MKLVGEVKLNSKLKLYLMINFKQNKTIYYLISPSQETRKSELTDFQHNEPTKGCIVDILEHIYHEGQKKLAKINSLKHISVMDKIYILISMSLNYNFSCKKIIYNNHTLINGKDEVSFSASDDRISLRYTKRNNEYTYFYCKSKSDNIEIWLQEGYKYKFPDIKRYNLVDHSLNEPFVPMYEKDIDLTLYDSDPQFITKNKGGRPRVLDAEKIEKMRQLEEENMSNVKIAKILHVSEKRVSSKTLIRRAAKLVEKCI